LRPIHEGRYHRDIQSVLVVDLVSREAVCLFNSAFINTIHQTEPRQRIRWLYAVNQHHRSIHVSYLNVAHPILSDDRVVCLHILFRHFFDVVHGTQGRFAKCLIHVMFYFIELVESRFDLITQSSSLVCIGDQVLYADLLSILRAKIVPVDFCDIKKSKFLSFLNCWNLLDFFLDLLASKKLPLNLNQFVQLSICQIILTRGSLKRSFYLFHFLVEFHHSS